MAWAFFNVSGLPSPSHFPILVQDRKTGSLPVHQYKFASSLQFLAQVRGNPSIAVPALIAFTCHPHSTVRRATKAASNKETQKWKQVHSSSIS